MRVVFTCANGGCANNLKIERGNVSELLLPEAEVEDEKSEAAVPPTGIPIFRYHPDIQKEEESDNESEFKNTLPASFTFIHISPHPFCFPTVIYF